MKKIMMGVLSIILVLEIIIMRLYVESNYIEAIFVATFMIMILLVMPDVKNLIQKDNNANLIFQKMDEKKYNNKFDSCYEFFHKSYIGKIDDLVNKKDIISLLKRKIYLKKQLNFNKFLKPCMNIILIVCVPMVISDIINNNSAVVTVVGYFIAIIISMVLKYTLYDDNALKYEIEKMELQAINKGIQRIEGFLTKE